MKVLMFGWEFPPNISGGLGTACQGITKGLSSFNDIGLTFVMPRRYGNETSENVRLIGANEVEAIRNKIRQEAYGTPFECYSVESAMIPYVDPDCFYLSGWSQTEKEVRQQKENAPPFEFTGKYGTGLMEEIHNFSVVAGYLAGKENYDIIHAHDWLTFPAGMAAKKILHKPLVVHVHATDFDRSGGKVNPRVYHMEKAGMDEADAVVTVSDHTREMVIRNYQIDPAKVYTVHNGVEPVGYPAAPPSSGGGERIVTFLGRITLQKGPLYFVEVAQKVLARMKNVRFVMAGSGDMLETCVAAVARAGIADRFSFAGFLKGAEVWQMFRQSDVYVMPSVSEPFGISPLEAMFCKVPVIISKQSGVSEVVRHAVKVDFWDIDAMADAIYSIIGRPGLKKMMVGSGVHEVKKINWSNTAFKIKTLYEKILSH
ncbi:MAG TPA: glycosyltransferase [Prolixibacteraceae bacterium]|nr:glycosyltransferase [Prolixibacteraceae bacterium]